MTKHDDDLGLDLDELFADAKAKRPAVDERLTARIIADAQSNQPGEVGFTLQHRTQGPFARLLEALGGWPALGGLVTAAVTGIYIGFAQPSFLTGAGEDLSEPGFATSSFLPGDDMFFEEG